jgi:hypothetical protein
MRTAIVRSTLVLAGMFASAASAADDDDFSDLPPDPEPIIINANCVWIPLGNSIQCWT